jgi:threonine synthase
MTFDGMQMMAMPTITVPVPAPGAMPIPGSGPTHFGLVARGIPAEERFDAVAARLLRSRMSYAKGLRCLRCQRLYPLSHHDRDCFACHAEAPSGLAVDYDPKMLVPRPAIPTSQGLWRYGDLLPVDASDAVTLGEAGTPLLPMPRIGAALGVEQLFIKDETRQPTGSFKDRLACIGVSAARAMGARVIVSSSSGNAGAAAAAYAARAGLPCIIFTFREASATLVTQMRALGAIVSFADRKEDRFSLVQQGIRRFGWFATSPFSDPVTGSNPLAVEGYKTLAYEIAEAMAWDVPDWCVLPVCYGDALAAIGRGFEDMVALGWTTRVPRLVAAEVSGSLGAALAAGDDRLPAMRLNTPSLATSIGAAQGTFQALQALRASAGRAVTVPDAAMLHWQDLLARHEGLWLEPSAAAALAAIATLATEGAVQPHHRVVALATAGGLKDPTVTASHLGGVPVVPADLDAALAIIDEAYGVHLAQRAA